MEPGELKWCSKRFVEIFRKCRNYAMIESKGYIGIVEFDPEIDSFHKTVINTNDGITFYGSSVAELRDQMMKSIEEYFQFCQEHNRKSEEPFSGRLTIQTTPTLHRLVALEAARHRVNLNTYIQEILKKAIAAEERM